MGGLRHKLQRAVFAGLECRSQRG